MPLLDDLLEQLRAAAQPRDDLITPGSTGALERARPVTYLGRVVKQGEMLEDVLSRTPIGEAESGGMAMEAPQLLKALIPPAVWKAMQPEARAAMNVLANKDPGIMKQLMDIPEVVSIEVLPKSKMPRAFGLMRGHVTDADRKIFLREDVPEHLPQVIRHEAEHAINVPKLSNMDPADAATAAQLINDLIDEQPNYLGKPSLETQLINKLPYEPRRTAATAENFVRELENASARSGSGAKVPKYLLPGEGGDSLVWPPGYAYGESYLDHLRRLSYDEALAHLADLSYQGLLDEQLQKMFEAIRTK